MPHSYRLWPFPGAQLLGRSTRLFGAALTIVGTLLAACTGSDDPCDEIVMWSIIEEGQVYGSSEGYVAQGPALWIHFFERDGDLFLFRMGGLKGVRWDEVLPDGRLGRMDGHFLGGIKMGGQYLDALSEDVIRSVSDEHLFYQYSDGHVDELPLIGDASTIPEGFWLERVWQAEGELYGIWAHQSYGAAPQVATAGLCVIGADGLLAPLGEPFFRFIEGVDSGVGLNYPNMFQGGWDAERELFQVAIFQDGYDLVSEIDRNGTMLAQWEVEQGIFTKCHSWQRLTIPPDAIVRTLSPIVLNDVVWSAVDTESGSWYLFNQLGSEFAEFHFLDEPLDPDRQLWFLSQYKMSNGTLWFAAVVSEEIVIRRWDSSTGTLSPEVASSGLFDYCMPAASPYL